MSDDYTLGRYSVVRYPTYWVVIDKAKDHAIVYESRSQAAAHARCKELHQLNKATPST